jgi:hypothetical protein
MRLFTGRKREDNIKMDLVKMSAQLYWLGIDADGCFGVIMFDT